MQPTQSPAAQQELPQRVQARLQPLPRVQQLSLPVLALGSKLQMLKRRLVRSLQRLRVLLQSQE
jgi:hypothetical protein